MLLSRNLRAMSGTGTKPRAIVQFTNLAWRLPKGHPTVITGKQYAIRLRIIYAPMPLIPAGFRAEALLFSEIRQARERTMALQTDHIHEMYDSIG